MHVSEYTLPVARMETTIALVSDLHNRNGTRALDILSVHQPAMIFAVGDIYERSPRKGRYATQFLKGCSAVAPTFFVRGNHELSFDSRDFSNLRATGVHVLENEIVRHGVFAIGATVPLRCAKRRYAPSDVSVFAKLATTSGFRILLSHHPEFYARYLRGRYSFDLVLSGHAHGGQIVLCGHGLYAPGQGIFPRYVHGLYDGCLAVCSGLSNTVAPIPRLFNPREVVLLHI